MLCRGREQEGSRRDRAFSPAADAFASEPEACEDAPLPAVIEALVLRRVLAQYACTSRACLGCASLQGLSPGSWTPHALTTIFIYTHCYFVPLIESPAPLEHRLGSAS